MNDPRYTKLAKLLVEYSTKIESGDVVLLDMIDVPDEFSVELMRSVRAAGGVPLIEVRRTRVTREVMRGTDKKRAQTAARPGNVPHEEGPNRPTSRCAAVQTPTSRPTFRRIG